MERYPSIRTLVRRGFTEEQARKIRAIMEGPCRVDGRTRLDRISDVINGFGVEHIPAGSDRRSPAIHYVNMGDTYDVTIMRVNGQFRVGAWGDIVERGNYA